MIAESYIEAEKLSLYEFRVHASACEKVCVRALLDDAAFLDDDDAVRLLDRAQTMGDDDDSPTIEILVERLLHLQTVMWQSYGNTIQQLLWCQKQTSSNVAIIR